MSDVQTLTDMIDPERLRALNTTLGVTDEIAHPFAHYAFFWEPAKAADLGRDGHPKPGQGLIPDMGLPRRMWAGGRLSFHARLQPGQEATKRSTRLRADLKEGRSGKLALVTLQHQIRQGDTLIAEEEQDLVYLPDPDPKAPKPPPPEAPMDETLRELRSFTTTELFRYSALTFNGHRIHYDRDYARDVEGYAGLVVHGPLLAQHLMLMAQAHLGKLARFDFRATNALMDFEDAEFCARPEGAGLAMWVRGPGGRLCMTAMAS